jgi:hypothetical protein
MKLEPLQDDPRILHPRSCFALYLARYTVSLLIFMLADALPAGMPKTGDATFDAWIQKMAAATPADPRDTADFKFINFTEKPPFTPKHKSLMAKHLTDEIWNK